MSTPFEGNQLLLDQLFRDLKQYIKESSDKKLSKRLAGKTSNPEKVLTILGPNYLTLY